MSERQEKKRRHIQRRKSCRVGRATEPHLQPWLLERLLPGAAIGRMDLEIRLLGYAREGVCRKGTALFLQYWRCRVPYGSR